MVRFDEPDNSSHRSSAASSVGAIESSLRLHEQARLDHQNSQPSPLQCFFGALSRRKPLDCRTDTNLNRCLSLLDLTALGVGSTLGLGLYVLAGQVASNKAGPAVVLSYAFAALASAFSAICYAEFAGRVPRAGSAYAYSYITVGEFVAFIIGWNMILEYVIGASSVARGFSGYLCFVGNQLTSGAASHNGSLPDHPAGNSSRLALLLAADSPVTGLLDTVHTYVAQYFDWPSVVIIAVVTVFILFGVKGSTKLTLVFTGANLLVIVAVLASSLSSLDLQNWRLAKSQVPAGAGEGGFLPFGWSGVLTGSATCFFGFIGFDTIASSAEEARNPKRNVPLSIILSLFISFLAYIAVATVQTLMWPYYDQDMVTILPYIFSQLNMPLTYWVVLVGALAGLASSQLSGMYPLPRVLYSMASDRLIYGCLAKVEPTLKLPVRATVVGSLFVALLACLLDIQDLADMVSIGTLAAYSLVSLSVLVLRYEDRQDAVDDSTILNNHLTLTDILSTVDHHSYPAEKPGSPADLAGQAEPARQKLTPKCSIPIREKGSKAVTAQLSVGFNSWFKAAEMRQLESEPASSEAGQRRSYLDLLISWRNDDQARDREPDALSGRQSKVLIYMIVLLSILIDFVVLVLINVQPARQTLAAISDSATSQRFISPVLMLVCMGCILLVALTAVMLMLSRLPTSKTLRTDMFQVPLVPLIPTLSILVNTFLMLNLSYLTWVRFTVWMAVGLFIYFTYGIWKSEGYLLRVDV